MIPLERDLRQYLNQQFEKMRTKLIRSRLPDDATPDADELADIMAGCEAVASVHGAGMVEGAKIGVMITLKWMDEQVKELEHRQTSALTVRERILTALQEMHKIQRQEDLSDGLVSVETTP